MRKDEVADKPLARIAINASPALSPSLLASPIVNPPLPPPLSGRCVLTFSGRHAIWNALRVLNVGPEENILVPSYCCGSETIPMRRYPVQVKYYRILRSMGIDLDHLVHTIDQRTKAVLVTHYLGFPQEMDPILELCKDHGLYLIEDCAHSLYGKQHGRWLGTMGDLGVFSMRKTLPLPDGGALLINNPALHFSGAMARPPLDAYVGNVKYLLKLYARARLGGKDVEEFRIVKWTIAGLRRYRNRGTGDVNCSLGHESFEPMTGNYTPSWVTQALLKRVRGEAVIRRRRHNYLFLLEHLDGIDGVRLVRPDLPEGVCPLAFPLRVSDSADFSRRLHARGIQAIPFWSHGDPFLHREMFADTYALKQTILAIPIHQDLTVRHLEKIVVALRRI